MAVRTVQPVLFVVPSGLDDPTRPSGGNTYDRRVIAGLRDRGWSVSVTSVPSPAPDGAADALAATLASAGPASAVVVVDGLVLRPLPGPARPRLVALVHLPHGVADRGARAWERASLAAAAAVVTTSAWTSAWLRRHYGIASVTVEPGADPAPLARGGGGVLSVGAVTPLKGHDVLVEAVRGLDVATTVVGALDLDPGYVGRLRAAAEGLPVRFAGPQERAALEAAYDAADLVVLPSRTETYGMVVTEALARGVPVVASDVGGVAAALGRAPDGSTPGVLVPAGDAPALAAAVGGWLADPLLRRRLRASARLRRTTLTPWTTTLARFEDVLNRAEVTPVSPVCPG